MTGDVTHEITNAYVLANIRAAQGRLREATRIYERALAVAAGLGGSAPPPVPPVAHAVAAAYDATDHATGRVLGDARSALGGNA